MLVNCFEEEDGMNLSTAIKSIYIICIELILQINAIQPVHESLKLHQFILNRQVSQGISHSVSQS